MEVNQKKNVLCTLEDTETTARICRALSNETRLEILRLLADRAMTISQLADAFYLPMSSMCLHIKTLREAGLIATIAKPGIHGTQKLCTISALQVNVDLYAHKSDSGSLPAAYVEMPIGHYASCQVTPPCGLASPDSYIHYEDSPYGFYASNHTNASLIWLHSGFLEYQFSNHDLQRGAVKQVEFSFEICSEAPGYDNNWPSDITLEINRHPVLTFTTQGDYGGRRGIYNPDWWSDSNTQFGEYKKVLLTRDGCYLGKEKMSDITMEALGMTDGFFFSFTLRTAENSPHPGGLNLFGRYFGDYAQDIVMKVVYD